MRHDCRAREETVPPMGKKRLRRLADEPAACDAQAGCSHGRDERDELLYLAREVDGRLSGRRLEHVRRVASTARDLALQYGVDPHLAACAGLLHDWDKKLSARELWDEVERLGLEIPRDERLEPLLHAWTAAGTLPDRFPELPASVFQAVGRHTVGACDMTDLDMVVFVADMLEPGRDGTDVARLRSLVGEVALVTLFARCVGQGIAYVVRSGRYLYPHTVDVWNAYCAHA